MWNDFRYAFRQLCKSPGFATTTVLTLALGIGANLAVFQLLYGVLLAHLPVEQPGQIYSLHAVKSPFDAQWFFSYPAYRRLRQATDADAPVFARSGIGTAVLQQANGAASRIEFQLVSDNFFSVLGLSPSAGQFFQMGDDQRQQAQWPVILRYGFFKEHFGADRSIVGKQATLNGLPVVVIGVSSEGFNGVVQGSAPDAWLPLAAQTTGRLGTWFDSLGPGYGVGQDKSYLDQPSTFWLWVLSRVPDAVKPAVSAHWTSALASDLSLIAGASKDPQIRSRILASHIQLLPATNGEGDLGKRYSLPLVILMAMAVLILLVGCLNLANLQMARLLQREREISVRIALGAPRARVLRQVAIEALVLAAVGGMLAFVTGRVCSALLLHWASGRGQLIPIDLRMGLVASVAGATLLLAALTGFGLLPAWLITRKSFATTVKSKIGSSRIGSSRIGGQSGESRAGRRWSNLLLASQVSLSLLLLCAAALFAQTLRNLSRIDAGMDREHVLSVHLDMRSTGFADEQRNLSAFYNLAIERLEALPAVRDAAVQMCAIPGCVWNTAMHVYGSPKLGEGRIHGEENHVGRGYFRTLGIALLQGRDFTAADNDRSQKVAILNRTYARKLFGDANPVGHWIGYKNDHEFLVAGEVADTLADGLRSAAPAVVYLPIDQNPQPVGTIEVRSRGSLKTLPTEIRNTLHQLAPSLPVTEIVALDTEFMDGLSTEGLLARLTSVFAALALGLAALGFYGLLSFRVARRTSEIGVRMAVGATRRQVQALLLGQTLIILVAGAIPGIVLSLLLGHLARGLLYGAGAMDVWALGFAVCALVVAGILATLVPARRAASIDPIDALRSE